MSRPLRRRLGALETRQAKGEQERRQRHVWWYAERGEPMPVAEPGEELHVYHWMLPDEEEPPGAAGVKAGEDAR